jgi:hypothetical protein
MIFVKTLAQPVKLTDQEKKLLGAVFELDLNESSSSVRIYYLQVEKIVKNWMNRILETEWFWPPQARKIPNK